MNWRLLVSAGEHMPVSASVQALAARISSTLEGTGLQHMEELLMNLYRIGSTYAEKVHLQRCFCDRHDRLVAEHGDQKIKIRPMSPALRFHQSLGEGKQVALYCDGHNIINSLQFIKEVCSRNHGDAR